MGTVVSIFWVRKQCLSRPLTPFPSQALLSHPSQGLCLMWFGLPCTSYKVCCLPPSPAPFFPSTWYLPFPDPRGMFLLRHHCIPRSSKCLNHWDLCSLANSLFILTFFYCESTSQPTKIKTTQATLQPKNSIHNSPTPTSLRIPCTFHTPSWYSHPSLH